MSKALRYLRRIVVWSTLTFIGIPLVVYLALLLLQEYSAWQASRVLTRTEALRIGAPRASVEKAMQSCNAEWRESKYSCTLRSGPYRSEVLLEKFWKLPEAWTDRILTLSEKIGLRYWDVAVAASMKD